MAIPGTNIRVLRLQMGLSQKALARAAEIDPANLSRLEAGTGGASVESLERIAKVLSVSLSVLFSETDLLEAAALNMRAVPVLTKEQLIVWRSPDVAYPEGQRFLQTDLGRVSRHCFALRVDDDANKPHFSVGDELIFDATKSPQMGSFVVAQDNASRVYLGRFRPMPYPVGGDPTFEVVPYDLLYPIGSSVTTPGLHLRGTLTEHRMYLP